MSTETFNEKFDELSSCNLYVGITRFKDIRLFNYVVSKNSPNMVGITPSVDYIEIENSVDFSFRIGKVGIKDYLDLRKSNSIMGNEILYIEYDNIKNSKDTTMFRKYGFFRVIGMEEATDAEDHTSSAKQKSRYITLTIAEYPYVDLLTFNKSNKTYGWDNGFLFGGGEKPIGSLVADMFTDPLGREITTTMGIKYFGMPTSDVLPWDWLNYYSPNWSKLKNINFLKRLATTFVGNYSYYFLNCSGDSITFNSIYSSYLFPPFRVEPFINKTNFISVELAEQIPYFDISSPDASDYMLDVKFKSANYTDAMFGGLSGETKFSFDFISGHMFNAYDYRMFKVLTSSNSLFYIYNTKFGNQTTNMTYSPFTDSTHNTNLKKYEYSKKSFNSMECEVTTFINGGRFLGQIADVMIGNSSADTKELVDPIFGQNWCVWGYKDIISKNRGISKVTLKKDSTWMPYFGLGLSMWPTLAG